METKGHARLCELNILVDCTACTQIPDTQSLTHLSLLQVRDAIMAAGIAGVGLAAVGLIGAVISRNKRQKQ